MKTVLLVLFMITQGLSSYSAANETGNGGGAWACKSGPNDHSVSFLRSADLFEAEAKGLLIKSPGCEHKCIEEHFLKRLSRLSPTLSKTIKEITPDIGGQIAFTNEPVQDTDDMGISLIPFQSCESSDLLRWVQIASYQPNEQILISTKAWKNPTLKEEDKAAILMHERIYRALRELNKDQTSRRTRRIVGLLFSSLADTDISRQISKILASNSGSINGEIKVLDNPSFVCKFSIHANDSLDSQLELWWASEGPGSARFLDTLGFQIEVVSDDESGEIAEISVLGNSSGLEKKAVKKDLARDISAKGFYSLDYIGVEGNATVACWKDF